MAQHPEAQPPFEGMQRALPMRIPAEVLPQLLQARTAGIAGAEASLRQASIARQAMNLQAQQQERQLRFMGAQARQAATLERERMDMQNQAFQAGQANQPKVVDKVAVQERLTVSLSGINTMNADKLLESVIRIVDVIKDAGLVIGPGPKSMIEIQLSRGQPATLATFRLSDTDSLRQQAYEAAMQQARSKAERLAQLAGVQLGEIVSIREGLPVSKDDNSGGMSAYFAMIGMAK